VIRTAAGDASGREHFANHGRIQGRGSKSDCHHRYTLALNAGDQWSDLKSTPEAELSVKYPDPYYFIP
jgi:hypothetical protein